MKVIQKVESLKYKQVRLINKDQSQVMTVEAALKIAEESGLDLVEMNADSDPVIVKMIDYGKMVYEKKKKFKQNNKPQKLKEIKFHTNIDPHDYNIKIKHIIDFLKKKHPVKITLEYRGREMAHQELGKELLNKVIEDTKEFSKVDSPASTQGRKSTMILSPKK